MAGSTVTQRGQKLKGNQILTRPTQHGSLIWEWYDMYREHLVVLTRGSVIVAVLHIANGSDLKSRIIVEMALALLVLLCPAEQAY